MAAHDSTERYYWPATAALDLLTNAAPKAVVLEAARLLDGGNTASSLLRGLAYISHLINTQAEDEISPTGRDNALNAVAAFTELVSRLIELGHESNFTLVTAAVTEWKVFRNAAVKAVGMHDLGIAD